ncbi:MAG: 2-isopropylmalate synthase [Planctomycetaceae bacterium]|jgi:2-isopropylmalate synthase|nr:2-isopropylmalate synthase [Planctomycetaceae bacterium]
MSSDEKQTVIIFDTTLRDGEQSPGASMNLTEKLEVAVALADLGVDVIEAGFPVTSHGDFEAVSEIAKTVRNSSICGLARCVKKDIQTAWDALKEGTNPRIHIFLATSPIHREYKLRKNKDELLAMAVEGIAFGRSLCPNIEFSAEDAGRTEIDFLCQVIEKAIDAGAGTVNIPDTVGYLTPFEMTERIRTVTAKVPNIHRAVVSTHCHNDLGMATANSLAAVLAGARQVECTINGIGERAGNCALEEIVMAIKTRHDVFPVKTNIVTNRLVPVSRLVSTITGLRVPRNKPIVGQNVFAHESGIHQDGVLKNPETYEIMRPEDVGLQTNDLVLGKHSGRAAIADRAKMLGYDLTSEQIDVVFADFKRLTDRKKEVYDADLLAIIEQLVHQKTAVTWAFGSYDISCGSGKSPKATLNMVYAGTRYSHTVSGGDGPVDAIFLAVREITKMDIVCKDYNVHSVTVGHDAQGEVSTLVEYKGKSFRGYGVSTDVVEASTIAFINAINKILQESSSF